MTAIMDIGTHDELCNLHLKLILLSRNHLENLETMPFH